MSAAINNPIHAKRNEQLLATHQGLFGYTNIDGAEIIVLFDGTNDDARLLNHFEYAIGENEVVYRKESDKKCIKLNS